MKDSKICECGNPMDYVLLSTDADGNRSEWGFYCSWCGC
jgi:hypothetical protein